MEKININNYVMHCAKLYFIYIFFLILKFISIVFQNRKLIFSK